MRPDRPPHAGRERASTLPRLLSIETVAATVDVSPKTVRRWISAGELPVHRLGRQLRISEADLAVFIARSRSS